mgnify:CR=1 FL=1
MSTAVSIVRTLLGLLFDHTIGNIVRMIPIIRLPKLERGPVSRGFLALLLVILFFGLTMLFSASYSSGYTNHGGNIYYFIKPQAIVAAVGFVVMLGVSLINYRALRYMFWTFYVITLALLVLALALWCTLGVSAEDTTTTASGTAGSFQLEQVYVNAPELDVYFYALDGDGNSYSPIKVQAAGPELTLGDRRLEVRSVAAASDPICYILALDNSKSIAPSEFYTMLGGVRKLINAMGDDDQLMLYTTAGSTECVLPATSDKNLMYKTLGSIKQVEGSMDTARLISAVYSELQSDYQALAPRKAAMIVTDAG